jgi:MoaA/NifB/PqqE/SkfB family radical SAM enzyme
MKKIIRIHQPDDAPMHLTWMINNICQNSCSYCPSDLHDGKNHYYEWEDAKRFFEMLFERYPKIHCSVSGGEPSMSPFFKDICKTFHEAGHTIGLTSNAAKSPEYWSELTEYLNYVCFSWHPEFPDPKFAEKAIAAGSKKPTVVRIMMHPAYWDKCVEAYNNFYKIEEIITEPVKIIDYNNIDPASYQYTSEQLEWFNHNTGNQRNLMHIDQNLPHPKIWATYYFNDGAEQFKANASDYVNQGMTNFNTYTCEVGLKSLFVRPNGTIYLGNCLVNGKIGNITKPDKIMWPTEPVKCNLDICSCSSDVNINKWID